MSKNIKKIPLPKFNNLDKITLAAATYQTLEEVGVEPNPSNMALFFKIKDQITAIRNSGQGIILVD